MKNILTLTACAALAMAAQAQTAKLVPFNVGNDSFANGMSRNGKYATYQRQAGEETVTFDVQLVDMETGKFISYTPQKMLSYRGRETQMPEGSYSQPFGVSEDGKTVFGTINGYPAYFTVDDLTWHCLSMGSVADNRNLSGAVYSMTPDGKKMVGWFAGEDLTTLKSAYWVDGEIVQLPNLPTYKDMYDRKIIDKYDYDEQKDLTPNYTFRKLSSDGTKLLLGIDHNRPQWGCSYGVYDLEKSTFTFILGETPAGGYTFTDSAVMSDNGEWVTGQMYFMGKDEMGADDYDGVYRYHVPTGKLEVFTDSQSNDLLATAIDDNGVIFAATPASQPIRSMVIRCGDLWVDLGKILDQKYGINFTELTKYDTTGYAVDVAADGKTILVQAEFRGGCYSLTLPVTFDKAAQGVSLLTEYMISPAPGKKFSKLSEVMLRFTYGATPVDGATILVKDSEGKTVGEATAIKPFSSQNILYTLTFPDIEMEEGKTYTVVIPAGTFEVVGSEGMTNPEITVSYVGRADTPVAYTAVTPKEDSYINVFSNASPVTLLFDADLSTSTAYIAKLYEEGKTEAVCNLTAQVNGPQLSLYPASERRLAKDKKYRIEIPAGIVSDLSGVGPNEAITLNYIGAFVPTPTIDPARPFFEDFNSPNEALFNFLMIDGDGHMPTEAMQAFGFDQWNTPWNFSIRDEGEYDYCAGSHSLYSPIGTSNDWMVIPQLTLNDGDYFLTFKGQSYLKSKNDQLRIVVWENDEVLGALDPDILARMEKEAKVLKEIRMTPSPVEGQLKDGWQEYEIPLADFAGKKIYIGFVNANRNQSMIFIDDLAVEYRGAYTLSVAAETNLTAAEKTDIVAHVNVNAAGPFDTLKATINVPSEKYTDTVELKDLKLTTGSEQTIEFKNVPLTAGEINNYTVTTILGGLSQTYNGKISNHAFEINRRVLVEEGTGMWCGNCPLGEVAIEHLEETMPESVAIVSVHNGDVYALNDYDQLLALGGYPNGRINRLDKTFQPMSNEYQYTTDGGDVTFMDAILAELAKGTEGEIKIGGAVNFAADGKLYLPLDVRFSLTRKNAIYNVFVAVVEDGLTGIQSNYFVNNDAPLLSWWSAQPAKVPYTYQNVARMMPGGFYGFSGMIPNDVVSGEVYHAELLFPTPSNVKNLDNIHFVVALMDATTGTVINADVCRAFEVNEIPGASDAIGGIEGVAADEISYTVTVKNGTIYVNGEEADEVYTTSGVRVANGNLAGGIYIVRAITADGLMLSKLVLVK